MLEFMHCLAAGDQKGLMTRKVLFMLWELAKEAPKETLCCSRLDAHLKILKLFCTRVKKWEVSLCEGIGHYIGAC